MGQSLHLFSLQKTDLQIDKINARILEIDKILATDKRVILAKNEIDNILTRLKKAKLDLSLVEEEVQSNKIKQETNEASLYGGRIHNPKELQDLQKDIDLRKANLAHLEEKQLESMISVDDIEKEKSRAEENLKIVQIEVIQQQASLAGEKETLIKNKSNFESERKAITVSVSPENLSTYDRLRQQKKGIAVTAVEDNACASCGSDLRPEEVQLANKFPNQLYFCQSCGRILFIG
jgi:uncharacterized protein